MPAALAQARLVLTAASVGEAAVGQAVGHVAGRPLPASLALAGHRGRGVPHLTLAATRAVVGTHVQPGGGRGEVQVGTGTPRTLMSEEKPDRRTQSFTLQRLKRGGPGALSSERLSAQRHGNGTKEDGRKKGSGPLRPPQAVVAAFQEQVSD